MTAEADIEEDGTAPDEAEVAIKGKRKRLLVLVGAGIGALLALGAASYFLLFAGGKAANESHMAAMPETFIFNLPTMTVNLNGDEEGEAFMKLTIALEVASERHEPNPAAHGQGHRRVPGVSA